MNISIPRYLYQNSLRNNIYKVVDANHQIDTSESCLNICDQKSCHISSTCIERSQFYLLTKNEDINFPKLGNLLFDTHTIKFEENFITPKIEPKCLNLFLFTSFFIHVAVIFFAVLSAELMESFVLKKPSRTDNTLMDIVMIDTDSFAVLPINHVRVTDELDSQFSSKSIEVPRVNLPKEALFQELQQNLNLKPTRNVELTNRTDLFYPEKVSRMEKPKKEASSIVIHTTLASEVSNFLRADVKLMETKHNINTDKFTQPVLEATSGSSSVKPTIKNTSESFKNSIQEKKTANVVEKKGNIKYQEEGSQKKAPHSNTKTAQRNSEFNGVQNEHKNNPLEHDMTKKNSAISASDPQNAKPIKRPYPEYPFRAAALNQEGVVTVKFDVNNNGRVTNIRIINSQPSHVFDKEVKRALRDWEYQRIPTQDIMITFEFKMRGITLK